MAEIVHLSGQRVTLTLHLTPVAPQRWALVDVTTDRTVGLIAVAGHGPSARATAYAAPQDSAQPLGVWQAVCPAHLAPTGPDAFGKALTMLRRSISSNPHYGLAR